jgi:phosphatidate cytidylyltransferase
MLKQRVITALVLLAVLLPALLAPQPWPFAAFSLLAVTAAGWEWARLNQFDGAAAVVAGALVALACGALWALGLPALQHGWLVVLLLWVLGGVLALRGGPSAWPGVPKAVRLLIGLVLLTLAWLALNQAKSVGVNFLLSVFALVWAADIAAYFGGRAFGRRKLAPSISPGKSWEGVYSGMAGVLLLALAWTAFDRHVATGSESFYTQLAASWGWLGAAVSLLLLTGLSVVGDLFESLVKRAAGAKDSSQLLPGHGGVLDRVDALLPVFPAALAVLLF